MISAVADTHAAVWYLSGDARLSVTARAIIDEAAQLGRKIAISSISLAELIDLVDKGRLDEKAYLDLRRALADARHVFLECLFTEMSWKLCGVCRDLKCRICLTA